MLFSETTAQFGCSGDSLYGVIARPEQPAQIGVVVIVGGPQTRVGSHRQFVLLSRALASQGYAVLRFDYRGMGDAQGEARDFLAVSADIGKAIDHLLQQVPQVQQVALWGLCDGASAALLYLNDTSDLRVKGLCLLNPWVRSEASLARAHVKHYYRERLMQKEFWAKLLSGKVALAALTGLWGNLKAALGRPANRAAAALSFQQAMAAAWRKFPGSIQLLLSGDDLTAREFVEYTASDPAWKQLMQLPNLQRTELPGFDHTCSGAEARGRVEQLCCQWLAGLD